MLKKENMSKYDSEKMYLTYDRWYEIANEAYNLPHKQAVFSNINHIVFAGMGGSGTIGDIFGAILSKTSIHVNVVKGYLLPRTVNSDTLVIITSVSGNTKETLSVLKLANKMKCKIIAFSSGGEMEKYCLRNNIEYRRIKKYHSPRGSLTSYLYTILKVLQNSLNIKENVILESINELKKMNKKINSSNLTETNPALQLANCISKIPMIYYPFGLQPAAIRFKNSLQENAKMHVIAEDIIEACHNGIVSWSNKSDIKPILIQGTDDYFKTKERWTVVKKFFNKNKVEFYEVFSVDGNILTKLICLIYILDYVSIYKAILTKIDPTPVEPIDFIKNNL